METKDTTMNEWQIAKEVLLSVIKWFLLFIFVNNLIWLLIVLTYTPSDVSGKVEHIEGSTINQEVRNG